MVLIDSNFIALIQRHFQHVGNITTLSVVLTTIQSLISVHRIFDHGQRMLVSVCIFVLAVDVCKQKLTCRLIMVTKLTLRGGIVSSTPMTL